MNWRNGTSIVLAAWWLLGMSHAGVTASGKSDNKKKPGGEPALVWPLPPEPRRIRFVTAYFGVNDFKKKNGRWKSMLLGPEQDQHVDRLIKPYGVAAARDGRVFVTDTVARRVFVFDPKGKSVGFIGDSGAGKISKPVGVAVDNAGTVFVADATLKRVFGYSPDGRLAVAIGHDGELQSPSGLALDRERGQLYVADAKKHQVFCYSASDGSVIRT